MHYQHRLEIGHRAGGADGVEVALHELAVAAPLGILTPPDSRQVVPLEGCAEAGDVLGCKTGKRYGQVEPHTNIPSPVVGEPVELLVGFFTALASEDLEVLKRRGVDRGKAV